MTLLLGGCGAGYRVLDGDTREPARVSYVILWGVDPGAPPEPPYRCERLGEVAVDACGEKCLHYQVFREAAQRLRGNGVVDIQRIGDEDRGTVVRCPLAEQ